jgi:hypothetical protein
MQGTYPETFEQKLHMGMNNQTQTPAIPQKGPACSLPASARFWLENFLFLASPTAAAAAKG